ncbi:MFS transporter permease [Paracoccus sp. TK19116]|uniref:MFS transporter permease n=1 Tax=Paracoccus albicereus TaxID=2922394 RepID=A0ABT1MWA4_9RHOB|nr:MFS transporter permease [Paracoccus albicereus]MCQ0971974.1 MFS transporter permease [Paracoccus albicereus]
MNLLRSAEQLLYEVVSWLVFYPLTLWRCLRHPSAMIGYAERELTKAPEAQFLDALSPPIFLFLTLLLVHMVQTGVFHDSVVLSGVLGDTRNLLVFRAVSFSLFPMLLGLQHVRLAGQRLSRETLRPMFYAQCYVTVPAVLALDLALMLGKSPAGWTDFAAWIIFLIGLVWYAQALMRGFMLHRGVSRGRALQQTALALVLGSASFVIAMLLSLLTGPLPLNL